MRSWDKYCEDTEKALVHFIDCIDQPDDNSSKRCKLFI